MKKVEAIIKPFKLDEVKEAPARDRRPGHDRHRGQGLRPHRGQDGGLPRRRVRRRLPAQGEARDHRQGRHRPRGRRGDHRKAAKTGRIGDGKIFVTPVDEVDPHPHRRARRGRASRRTADVGPISTTTQHAGGRSHMTPARSSKFAEKNGAKMVDFKFVDFLGIWQHFTMPIAASSNEDVVRGGLRLRRLVDPRLAADQRLRHAA